MTQRSRSAHRPAQQASPRQRLVLGAHLVFAIVIGSIASLAIVTDSRLITVVAAAAAILLIAGWILWSRAIR